MSNSDLKRQIEWAMRRVPRYGGGWRYLPLHQMPEGTEISFEAEQAEKPTDEKERRLVNNKLETDNDVLWLPEGRYRLFVSSWPQSYLILPNGERMDVRPLRDLLAPSSVLEANFETENSEHDPSTAKGRNKHPRATKRLTTGKISVIVVPETKFRLKIEDRHNADKHKRNSARPRSRPRRSRYRPLRYNQR